MEQNTTKLTITQKYTNFIESYIDNGGNISRACEEVGINRTTFYRWLKRPKFKIMFDDALEKHNDLIFQRILKMALDSDKDMLKFWARTQMKHRGFSEKQEIELSGKVDIPVWTKEEKEAELKRLFG